MLLDLACARASLSTSLNAIRMVSRETRVLRALSGVNFKARGRWILHVQHWDFSSLVGPRPDRRVDMRKEQRIMPPASMDAVHLFAEERLKYLAFRCNDARFAIL